MPSGDVIFEMADAPVTGLALGSEDTGNIMQGGTTELSRLREGGTPMQGRVVVQPYYPFDVFFDRTKTYDIVIKEH